MSYQGSDGKWYYQGSTVVYASEGAANYYGPRDSYQYSPTSTQYPTSVYTDPVTKQEIYAEKPSDDVLSRTSPDYVRPASQIINPPEQNIYRERPLTAYAQEDIESRQIRKAGGKVYSTFAQRKVKYREARKERQAQEDYERYLKYGSFYTGKSKYDNPYSFANPNFPRSQAEINIRDLKQSQNTLYEIGQGGQVNYTPAGQKILGERDVRRQDYLQKQAFQQKFGFSGPSTIQITKGSTVQEQKNYYKPMTDLGTYVIKPETKSPYLKVGEKLPNYKQVLESAKPSPYLSVGEKLPNYSPPTNNSIIRPRPFTSIPNGVVGDFFRGTENTLENLVSPILAIPQSIYDIFSGKSKPTGILGLPGTEPPKEIVSGKGSAYEAGKATTTIGIILAPLGAIKGSKGLLKATPSPPKIPSSSGAIIGGGSNFKITNVNLGWGIGRLVPKGGGGGIGATLPKKSTPPKPPKPTEIKSGKGTVQILREPIRKPITKTQFIQRPIFLGKSKTKVVTMPKQKLITSTIQKQKQRTVTLPMTKAQKETEKYLASIQLLKQQQKKRIDPITGQAYLIAQVPQQKQKQAYIYQPKTLQKTKQEFINPQIQKQKQTFVQPPIQKQKEKSAVMQYVNPITSPKQNQPNITTQTQVQKQIPINKPIQNQLLEPPKSTPTRGGFPIWFGGGDGGGGRRNQNGARKVFSTFGISTVIPRGYLPGPFQRVSHSEKIFKEIDVRESKFLKKHFLKKGKKKTNISNFL